MYGANRSRTNVSAVVAVPDLSGDRMPDTGSRSGADSQVRVHHSSTTHTDAPVRIVLRAGWRAVKASAEAADQPL